MLMLANKHLFFFLVTSLALSQFDKAPWLGRGQGLKVDEMLAPPMLGNS